ncbi:uncharacterized protein LOC135643795 [Musa acuminata AAA Group]|uniref:uncharacterized protein LOC135643795 n=1 Tax=Musa acuminata AAA Group TaxID=214697 RepID=UPI0031D38F64
MEKAPAGASANRLVWDCGSSLYDSFELESLMRQLDSAGAGRCFSMPHSAVPPPPPPPPLSAPLGQARRKRSRVARWFKNMAWLVLRSKPLKEHGGNSSSGCLASISEAWGRDLGSPECGRKIMSERFTDRTIAAKEYSVHRSSCVLCGGHG